MHSAMPLSPPPLVGRYKLPLADLATDAVAVRFDAAAVGGRNFFREIIDVEPRASHNLNIGSEGEGALKIARVIDRHHIPPSPRALIFSNLTRKRFHNKSCFFFRLAYRRVLWRFVFIHAAPWQRPCPWRVPMRDEHHVAVLYQNDAGSLN